MSVYNDLWLGAETIINVAGPITINGSACTVKRSKTTMARELLETLPVVGVVIGDQPESSEPFHAGGAQSVRYLLQLVVITASNRDQLEPAEDLLGARETLRALFQRPDLLRDEVDEVLRTWVLPNAPIARSAFLKGYDFSALAVRVECIEEAD